MALRLVLLAAAVSAAAATDAHIVLPPVHNATGLPEQMLVFIPGGKVPNVNYEATARAIQQAATGLKLWVVIPGVFQRLCIISCATSSLCSPLHNGVEASLSQAQGMGWTRPAKDVDGIWLAGHSLGGTCANYLFQGYSSDGQFPYAGVIEMGSYVDRSGEHDVYHYPMPVLTMNGELDGGMARPGKTALWWEQFLALEQSEGKSWALANKPVVVLEKMNHSDFCPGFDVAGDLMAEIDQQSATQRIGSIIAAFLHLQKGDKTLAAAAEKVLQEPIEWTREFLAPYLAATVLEHNADDHRGQSREGASAICEQGQLIIAGLSGADRGNLSVYDKFNVASLSLEHCHPDWVRSDGHLMVRTCGHADYYRDIANTGSIKAASQIACKMISGERMTEQLGVNSTDVDCRAINKHVVALAESMAPNATLQRYRKNGRGWCYEEDSPVLGNIGPLWLAASMKYTETATCMSVASSTLKTAIDGKIYPGSHYCKVLSPARVLDWMMTDALKPFTAAAGTAIFV